MIVRNLGEQNSIANQFLLELRDTQVQKDRLRFRHNLSRLGALMAYELSKELPYQPGEVKTSLGKKVVDIPLTEIVLVTSLRAGLPLLAGLQGIFRNRESRF